MSQLPEGGDAGTGEALTPDGNLTLIDDILQTFLFREGEKWFVEAREGS